MMTRQIPLSFDFESSYDVHDYIVAPSNQLAYDAVMQGDMAGAGLYISGPQASGKTHLAHIWCMHHDGLFIDSTEFGDVDIHTISTMVAIDNFDQMTPDQHEKCFHLYNRIFNAGGKILLTGQSPAGRLDIELPDLSSRVKGLNNVSLDSPDDEILRAMLVKQFSDRQIHIDGDVLSYCLTHMERSFAAVHYIVNAADKLSLAEKRTITKPLIRSILNEVKH